MNVSNKRLFHNHPPLFRQMKITTLHMLVIDKFEHGSHIARSLHRLPLRPQAFLLHFTRAFVKLDLFRMAVNVPSFIVEFSETVEVLLGDLEVGEVGLGDPLFSHGDGCQHEYLLRGLVHKQKLRCIKGPEVLSVEMWWTVNADFLRRNIFKVRLEEEAESIHVLIIFLVVLVRFVCLLAERCRISLVVGRSHCDGGLWCLFDLSEDFSEEKNVEWSCDDERRRVESLETAFVFVLSSRVP